MARERRQVGFAGPPGASLPEVTTLAIGECQGRHVLLWLTSLGDKVARREVVEVTTERGAVERTWRELAWVRFFRGEQEPDVLRERRAAAVADVKPEAVGACVGLGIVRQGREGRTYAVVKVEADGSVLTGVDVLSTETSRWDAWCSLEREAVWHLLEDERAEAALRSAGWQRRPKGKK